MKTKCMKLALFALCGLILLPQSAAAYEVTDSQAIQLDDNTYLFTISYKFGFLNRNMATPMFASNSPDSEDKVGYQININGEPATGIQGAVVLTKSENVTENSSYYVLPERKNAIFTLVGIVRSDTEVKSADMIVTKLPYITNNGEESKLSGVTDEELLEYKSPTLLITEAGAVSIKSSIVSVSGETK